MNNLSMDQKLLLFKVLVHLMGDKTINIGITEIDTALSVLYDNTDKQLYWTTQQKENFKNWVRFCKIMHQMQSNNKRRLCTI